MVCRLKKTLSASECDEEERAAWREQVGRIDPKRLVFVDECGTQTSMTRHYAWAPRGERAYGSVPRDRGKKTTLLASMSLEGIGAAMAVEGSTTAKVFEAYVERFLAPTLKPGQVVIVDNLSAHKSEKAKELIESRAASLVFLPAYLPDFSPSKKPSPRSRHS